MNRKFSKEESKENILNLVDQFDLDFNGIKNPQMKEAQLEDKFIKPLFYYLNWNIHNDGIKKGREEFRVQTSHKINKSTKEPDYELWLPHKNSGKMKRHLFMEAKDPKYDLHKEVKFMRQAYQYAHSTLNISDHSFNRTRLSILTDFEEFRLFDCLDPLPLKKNEAKLYNKYIVKPFDLHYKQYESEFNNLWDAFERNNVLNGSFSEFQVTDEDLKKNRIAPDLMFLDDLKYWRLEFAKSMYKSNKEVSEEFLTSASQILINRIIFLKMLTDKEIEKDFLSEILNNLESKSESLSIYDSCRDIFQYLDKSYNGDIFKKREEFDYVKIENKVFSKVIDSFRPENSVYTLSAMPVEIIGNTYEQFLGEVIVHRGRGLASEEKPEVQKSGGVYYTPRYIVDYILEKTLVEKLNKCQTPNDVSKIKILDPACGSGSFLIGAFDCLINWYLEYYKNEVIKLKNENLSENDINKKFKEFIKYYDSKNSLSSSFDLHLTSKLKKNILLNNIYGVDIDSNAIEITKFSLSMKAIEGSTHDELYEDIGLFQEQILPRLDNNIKCGNSLVEDDYFKYFQDDLFQKPIVKKINPFNWKDEFSSILNDKKFDVIIGNPPYLGFQEGNKNLRSYFEKKYSSSTGKYDQYVLFIELSFKLLSDKGLFGFINPNKFIHSQYGKGLKSILLNNIISEIIDFRDLQIFNKATNYPCIIIAQRGKRSKGKNFAYSVVSKIEESIIEKNILEINQDSLSNDIWLLVSKDKNNILKKLEINSSKLKNFSYEITQGMRTGSLKVFYNNINIDEELKNNLESDLLIPIFHGKNVKKYQSLISDKDIILYPYTNDNKSPIKIENFPLAYSYLSNFRNELKNRKDSGKFFKDTNKKWFEYWDSKPSVFKSPKIIFPDISAENNFHLDEQGIPFINTCYAIFPKESINPYALLAYLNSSVVFFYIKSNCPSVRGGYYRYKTNYINEIPVPNELLQNNNLISGLEKKSKLLVELYKDIYSKSETESKSLFKHISLLENEINLMVYEIFELDKEDIFFIES